MLKDGQGPKKSFYVTYSAGEDASNYRVTIYGAEESRGHKWVYDAQGNLLDGFREMCVVQADLRGVQAASPLRQGRNGSYQNLGFEIGITFGATSMDARVLWVENGQRRSGPATIIPTSFY